MELIVESINKDLSEISNKIDNIKKNTFRQYLGKVYFRLFLKRIFDAVFVPGVQSRDFLKYLDVSVIFFVD